MHGGSSKGQHYLIVMAAPWMRSAMRIFLYQALTKDQERDSSAAATQLGKAVKEESLDVSGGSRCLRGDSRRFCKATGDNTNI